MARLRRRPALALRPLPARLAGLACGLAWLAGAPAAAARDAVPPGLHDRPVLVVDPGGHTAQIWRADVDAAGRVAVTASHDRTVRVWSPETGELLRTIRLPAGPGNVGRADAVAIDPAGELIAAGGWMTDGPPTHIYLLSRASGALVARIGGLPEVVNHLAFSPDGRHLAAVLHGGRGLRVFGRDAGWAEVARDEDYGDAGYGAAFAADGRLATTAYDGRVRLYGAAFARLATARAPGGRRPVGIAFGPDGARLALGHDDTPEVDVLDARTLAPLEAPDVGGVDNGDLGTVAWAADGTLLAGGSHDAAGVSPVLAWAEGGRGARRTLPAGTGTVMGLRPLPGGDLLVAAADPWLGRLAPDGRARWARPPPLADLRNRQRTLAVSADGRVVDFGYDARGAAPARFDLGRLALAMAPAADGRTAPPRQTGLAVEGWDGGLRPTLDGAPLRLDPHETAFGLALHPDGARFVLGTSRSLRAFDARGEALWRQPVPDVAWAVNVAGDGRLAVAAYADGTLRWHRMDDGREVLALMPLADRANWVAWTPEGFYAASPGAHGVLRWHVNRPGWRPADSYAVAEIPGFYRPEAIPLVLRELETPRAVGLAAIAEQRRKVQIATGSGVPPGAKLHLLAVGVSRYDERHAGHLRLDYAHQDAHDVMSALGGTQDALYTLGPPQYLADGDATRGSILRGLAALRGAMTGKDDLAVLHFSGHGAMVDGQLYLLPHDVDARDAATISDTALPVAALRAELMRVAERGRVLVLLDACYSGGASLDGRAETVDARSLGAALAAANVTVLTSSSASQASREDPAWRNGAFTEAVLEALGGEADENKDGLVGATELARYVDRRVRALTRDAEIPQTPAMEVRYDGTLFVVR